MNLHHHYDQLWDETIPKYHSGVYGVDPNLNNPDDRRYGITLLIRPPREILSPVTDFLQELQKAEPGLYYYNEEDIHLTVLSIISCYVGFELNLINVNDHIGLIKESLKGIEPFNIHFKGITAASSAVMIQGFPEEDKLNQIRDSLRLHYKRSDLQHRMDVRYAIKTAHSSVIRFPQKPSDSESFISLLEKYRTYDFGLFTVDTLEFVFNDWYQQKEKGESLATFHLG